MMGQIPLEMLEVRRRELDFFQNMCFEFGSCFGCSVLRELESDRMEMRNPKINCRLLRSHLCASARELSKHKLKLESFFL